MLQVNREVQPAGGKWHDWKQEVADHCGGYCIYCAISEARFGGIRNFHIEHYRPKKKFPQFENEIRNLYLACAICNVLKCDDWPAEPADDHSTAAYPDPAISDYNGLFELSNISYSLESPTVAGKYVIERLLLNRGQLILERRLVAILLRLGEFQSWVDLFLNEMTIAETRLTASLLSKIVSVQRNAFIEVRPYRDAETKRPIKSMGQKRRSKSSSGDTA